MVSFDVMHVAKTDSACIVVGGGMWTMLELLLSSSKACHQDCQVVAHDLEKYNG